MASQQVPRADHTIEENEKNTFKLMKMTYHIARSVLYKVFLWGTKQEPNQSVKDYLLNTKGYSKSDCNKYFYSYQLQLMSDKSLECNFDVSTLARVIRHTCDKLNSPHEYNTKDDTNDDGKLDCLVTKIKCFRNELSHNFKGITLDELFSESTELLNLLQKTLTVAGKLYGKSTEEVVEEKRRIEENIKTVRDQSLAASDIHQYEVIQLNEKLKSILKVKGRKELEKRYERLCHFHPVDLLENGRVLVDVSIVFTQIEVECVGCKAKGLQVPCQELLSFCRSYSASKCNAKTSSPEAYLLEGPAGAGKTTLMKFIKAGWSRRLNKDEHMLGLDDFDLLLLMECRNTSISSFSQLLSHLMPETNSRYLREGDLLRFTRDLKTLILVDGLDEMNSSSEKLFLDIINQDNINFVIFCTSRPEKTRYFVRHVPSTFHTAHLKITGIADDKKENFVRKYHEEMQRQGRSKQDTEGLLNFIKRSESSLKSHYCLPLNLVLLTWLWADGPDSVTPMTTSSELYIKTHNLMKKKLLDRLSHNEGVNADEDELEEKIRKVLYCLYEQAFYSLKMDAIKNLLPWSVKQIKATCKAYKLPDKETLSAFFVIRIVEGDAKVSVPHKMLHDFYAAQYVVQNLFNKCQKSKETKQQMIEKFLSELGDDPVLMHSLRSAALANIESATIASKPGSLKAFFNKCLEKPTAINKYQTMLLQVAGITYALYEHEVKEWIAKEIVDLLKESELGIKDNNQWFELIELTKNNHDVISFVAGHIDKAITITEERVEVAFHLLHTARPKKISLDITSKTKAVPRLKSLLQRIADCECDLDLAFWEDFSNPESSPSNDEELRIISQR